MIGDRERAWRQYSAAHSEYDRMWFNTGWQAGYIQAARDRIGLIAGLSVVIFALLIIIGLFT